MNPGPAPRPPTDRPRLNTASTNSSIATSFGQMSVSSSAATTPTLSVFPNTSTLSLSQTRTNTSTTGGVTVIKEGYVRCKEDKFLASWNQRYLVLREYRLDFLKNETGKVVLSIQLNNVTSVTRSEDTRMAFEITRVANPKDANSRSTILTRDLPTKTITCEVKNDDEIYEWIDKIYERCPGMGGVSNPTNFNHRVHVGFDPQTGAFVGLPTEWEKLLSTSAITKEDYKKNPQAVIEALEFYSDIQMRDQDAQLNGGMAPGSSHQGPQMNSVGASIAGPRTNQSPVGMHRVDAHTQRPYAEHSANASPIQSHRKPSDPERGYDAQAQPDRSKELPDPDQRRRMDEEARRIRELQRQREEERREQEAYNASLPKSRPPMAQQELGGYGGSDSDAASRDRFNPSRPAPQVPGSDRARQQPNSPGSVRQMTAQRPAPSPPVNGSSQRGGEASNGQGSLRTAHRPEQSNNRLHGGDSPTQAPRQQNNGTSAQGPIPGRVPGPVQTVKPLNIANKQTAANAKNNNNNKNATDGVRQAEAALTKKPAADTRQKDVRMSTMTESEVMERLKQVVAKDNPNYSYSKQRKIGQGASGSVYVARVKENATSPVARELYRTHGPRGQVAIKQMDLRSQPRKELIVNEIIVMKDSQHPNIVNFLDSFLQEQNNELWVVMEFMEGGALTDVIESNPLIQEDQIATICYEVGFAILHS